MPEIVIGSVSRNLAMLAAALSDWARAERHYRDALEMNARMGARPWLAYTREGHARMLLRRNPNVGGPARELAEGARDDYRELGMDAHAERASRLVDQFPS